MKKAKRILAALLTMVMFCGVAAIGVSAAEEITPAAINVEAKDMTKDQLKELRYYLKTGVPAAALEVALRRVPRWLRWAVFSKGSTFEDVQADLKAEFEKEKIDYGEFVKWIREGKTAEHSKEILRGNKVIAEKGPAIFKKHCVFYIDWIVDIIVWINGISIARPLPA